MGEDELELLRKFKDIIEVSREVKKAEIAKYLGITEDLLFEKLIHWGKDIPFKIKGEMIEIDDMNEFIVALDRQFDAWDNKEKSEFGKSDKNYSENSTIESPVFVSEISSAQPSTNTKLQDKFEFLLTYAENSMNSHRYDEAIKYFERATTVAENLLDGDLIRKTEELIKKAEIQQKNALKCKKLAEDARNLMENNKWDKAMEIWEKIAEVSSVYGWEVWIKTSQEEIKTCVKEKAKTGSYRGTLLAREEYFFMMALDNLIGNIPALSEIKLDTFGFRALDNQIIQLNLNNKKLTSLPESIGNLRSLMTLGLSDNKLSSLPESIGDLTALIYLQLWRNKLTSLPETIGSLTSLKKLDLGNNKLNSLPESIGHLKSLTSLVLYNNQLSSLPENIGDLKSLTYLDLSVNELSYLPETIKKWIKQLKKNGCNVYQ